MISLFGEISRGLSLVSNDKKSAYQISLYAGVFSEGFLLIIALFYCFRSYNPKFLHSFPIFCLVEFCTDLILISLGKESAFKAEVANFMTLLELTYLVYLLNQIIKSDKAKNIIWLLVILFYLQFSIQLIKEGINFYYEGEVFFESIILIIPCLVYFKEIFADKFKNDLTKDPGFWIATGTILYFSTSIPLVLSRAFFAEKNMWQLHDDIYIINNFSLIVANILYVKACTCRIEK